VFFVRRFNREAAFFRAPLHPEISCIAFSRLKQMLFFHFCMDGFNNYNGIIDDDSNSQYQSKQRDC
jgi:hypothetical protein